MGQPTLIIGSARAGNDLLDARGSIYSDRPIAVMAGELVGWNRGLGYCPGPFNHRFREFRRLFQQFIGPRASQGPGILAAQEAEARNLTLKLIQDPAGFVTHIRQSSGALIVRLAYGYRISTERDEDPLVKIVEEAMRGFSRASEPGAFLVDSFPILKYLPEWAPGSGFKAVARRMRKDLERMCDIPFEFVKNEMGHGRAEHSFTSACLKEKASPTPKEEEFIKSAAAALYSGGADTSPSPITCCVLIMTLHPNIQACAQAELDVVLGSSWSRLPTFSDRSKLPYISAVVQELLRWMPTVPLGLPHRVTQDDIYEGYHITKGTVIWANIWSMLHDPTVFPDPETFRPERFLCDDGTLRELDRCEDPSVIGFGFGRRICPGMYMAVNSVFIAVATMLYVLDISKARDEHGAEIEPEVECSGFICHPVPFKCSIRPRSAEAEHLIRRALQSEDD
ncbi:O-methylsterigmatocystin oxidoreductase [Grifola frondosa]|uniref:O-methylsterigmatocystin oxidoreductase n=1 Tax=Grifola frondosa TaxID=5627 RepID=A0A1C7MMC0_GRIFR|nr:O-methylsterigmatocystin oxidoreductase [Grifola frondosa]